MSETMTVGKKLVELCREGKMNEALETLYSQDIISVEATGGPQMPQQMEGMAAIKGKAEWWQANHEVHSSQVDGPWPHGDRFIVRFLFEVTPKAGPMAGQRMKIDEAGLYTVKDGKVAKEEFFYDMGM